MKKFQLSATTASKATPEPFGKLNRREAVKVVAQMERIPARRSVPGSNTKLYLRLAGGVLLLFMVGYAFAQ